MGSYCYEGAALNAVQAENLPGVAPGHCVPQLEQSCTAAAGRGGDNALLEDPVQCLGGGGEGVQEGADRQAAPGAGDNSVVPLDAMAGAL